MGSGITYAKRFGLQSMLGLPSEDDDGNEASKPSPKVQTLAEALGPTHVGEDGTW